MGAEQAAKTLTSIKTAKNDHLMKEDEIFNEIKSSYDKQSDARYAAARLWSDEIIFLMKLEINYLTHYQLYQILKK